MGKVKNDLLEKEERWYALCDSKGWRCGYCGERPEPYDAPISTPYICGACQHMLDKDD